MSELLIETVKEQNLDKVSRMILDNVDLEYVNSDGMTALLVACEQQDSAMVELLVSSGADVNHLREGGYPEYSPLDYAGFYGELTMARYTKISQDISHYLRRHGAVSFVHLTSGNKNE